MEIFGCVMLGIIGIYFLSNGLAMLFAATIFNVGQLIVMGIIMTTIGVTAIYYAITLMPFTVMFH